jgi:hypothetical protein
MRKILPAFSMAAGGWKHVYRASTPNTDRRAALSMVFWPTWDLL